VDQPLQAQTNYTWIGGTGSWNTGGNWDLGVSPEAFYEETATINNGGTATLNTTATNTQSYDPGTGIVPGAVGGLVLGQNLGDSGTLRVTSGGVINFVDSTGAATGIANIGLNGTGVLEVQGGGTFSTTSIDVNTGSQVIVGGGTGIANVASTGNSWFGGTTTVRGPGHNFSVTGDAFFEGTGIYNPVISAGTHSPLRVSGSASLGGSLKVDFGPGYNPAVGNSWNLVDATVVTGNFSNAAGGIVTVEGEHAAELGSAYRVRTVSGGTNGSLLQLSLESLLVLRVNRDTGALSIVNPLGASVPALDSYTITSSVGSLLSSYKGISGAPAGDTGWEKAPQNSTNGLAEFKATGGLNVSSASTNLNLGAGFSKTAVASQGLGVNGEDLVFNYHTVGGAVAVGQVEYIGTRFLNDLVLSVNTSSGLATLKNDTLQSVAIDGYSLVSSTEDLVASGWTGLGATFPNWLKSPATASALSETNAVAPLTLTAGQSVSLGTIGDFSSLEAQDGLALKFLIGSEQAFRLATVQFVSGATQQGDFDGDGDVDGRDFLRWQRGQSPNPLSASDLAAWKSNYGTGALTATATAVPEPSTIGLTLLGSVAMLARRRRHSTSVETRKDNLKMNRFGTLNSARGISAVAAWVCLAMLQVSVASAQILGLNFGATDPDSATSSLASTDVAGVVPVANWNNLTGNVGTNVTGLFYDNNGSAVASSATLTWNSPNTWRSGTNNAFPAGPDRNLLSGYLDTGDTTATGITITLSGIDAALRTNFYDVYLYFVSDSGDNRGGGYRVNDGNTSYLRYGSTLASPSAYVQDPGVDVNNSVDGNYLRFRGLSGASLTITSDTTLTSPNGFRAPINAVEIVSTIVGPGDADENGVVDVNDYTMIRSNLETSVAFYTNGDVDGSGFVDLNDFALWRDAAPLSALIAAGLAVPEPSTAALFAAAVVGLLGRRRSGRRQCSASALVISKAPFKRESGMKIMLPCVLAVLGLCLAASPSHATVTMTIGATPPTPGTHDQYTLLDDATIPGGTTPGGGTYNSQAFSDNNGPPGQIFTTPASSSPSLPAYKLNTIWLKGAEASAGNFGGFSDTTTWSIRISEVNGVLLTPVKTVTGIASAAGITGGEWFTWTFSAGDLQTLQANKQYAFDLFSTQGWLGFDANTQDTYVGGTAFNSGGGGSRNFNGLTTGNLANHGYDRTFLVGLSPSVLLGPGDVDGDGDTDLVDYGIIKTNFFLATGATRTQGDLTGDGRVLLDDFAVWKNNAAGSLVAQVTVPEPSSLALLAAAGALGCLRRWNRD
jgi:hypothetical protein